MCSYFDGNPVASSRNLQFGAHNTLSCCISCWMCNIFGSSLPHTAEYMEDALIHGLDQLLSVMGEVDGVGVEEPTDQDLQQQLFGASDSSSPEPTGELAVRASRRPHIQVHRSSAGDDGVRSPIIDERSRGWLEAASRKAEEERGDMSTGGAGGDDAAEEAAAGEEAAERDAEEIRGDEEAAAGVEEIRGDEAAAAGAEEKRGEEEDKAGKGKKAKRDKMEHYQLKARENFAKEKGLPEDQVTLRMVEDSNEGLEHWAFKGVTLGSQSTINRAMCRALEGASKKRIKEIVKFLPPNLLDKFRMGWEMTRSFDFFEESKEKENSHVERAGKRKVFLTYLGIAKELGGKDDPE